MALISTITPSDNVFDVQVRGDGDISGFCLTFHMMMTLNSVDQCGLAPSANFVTSNDTVRDQGSDHWVDLWTQWTYCEPDVDQDFVYYLDLMFPHSFGGTRMLPPSLRSVASDAVSTTP